MPVLQRITVCRQFRRIRFLFQRPAQYARIAAAHTDRETVGKRAVVFGVGEPLGNLIYRDENVGRIVVDDDGNKTVSKDVRTVKSGRDSMYVLGYKLSYVTVIIGIAVFLAVIALVVIIAVRRVRRRAKKGGES